MPFLLRWPLLSLLLSSAAIAQTAEKTAAVVLFDEAEALAARGDFSAACPKYAESHRLDPQLGALLHVADCYERVEQFARAWSGFREAAEVAAKRGDPRQPVARSRAEALEPRVSRLTVVVPVENRIEGLTILLDGVELGNASWELSIPVDGGVHRVAATAPGRSPFETEVRLAVEGDRQEITIPTLTPTTLNVFTSVPETMPHPRAPQERPHWQIPTIVGAYAVGVAAVVVGSVFQYKRLQGIDKSKSYCPNDTCTVQEYADLRSEEKDARRAGLLSVGSFILGGGLLLGGTALFVFGKPTEQRTKKPAALNIGSQGVEFSYAF